MSLLLLIMTMKKKTKKKTRRMRKSPRSLRKKTAKRKMRSWKTRREKPVLLLKHTRVAFARNLLACGTAGVVALAGVAVETHSEARRVAAVVAAVVVVLQNNVNR